ncbi:glycerol uptake facilitator protein [Tangfeifania diversioriginum]|uniref:Glycerol uptake facilitator protein n=1 Tax=Tangfeifania diversioriginum TaxID=1168035 RepID=A0A1M6A484_9BACT|nr:MIP/aquaporin family protein [Tangfeifania diversioriginum]SHI31149.1 glycerol uptake facilitator protein [Tangfeifania diversioriginum]
MMIELFGELLGTFILIVLGNGVVANVNLDKTHSHGAGWIVITAGWGMAVFVAVLSTADLSGAHINPAVTLGLAFSGLFEWAKVAPFILAQMLGAMLGALTVYIFFKNHFDTTETPGVKKSCFCTAPAIRNYTSNFFSEVVGTFILVLAVLLITMPQLEYESFGSTKVGLGSLGALPVALVVFAIGLSLGGTTGYAINPARDLGPRIVHWLLPVRNKKDNTDWAYSWIPALGPVTGAALASLIHYFISCNC